MDLGVLCLLLAAGGLAEPPAVAPEQPAYQALDAAYSELRDGRYSSAIDLFRRAAELAPGRADIQKNLGYVYLRVGENIRAREAFQRAAELDPGDLHAALEYAFLAHETGERIAARRTFERLARAGDPVALRAFENIDRPLREGIERWQRAIELAPGKWSNHEELAKLAESRDQLDLAGKHYAEAWKLRPSRRDLLLSMGRMFLAQKQDAAAMAALLAASRGAEPRTAERARSLLPSRYPYVYEFREALALDAGNVELRRELAYLLLEMKQSKEAEALFEGIVAAAPDDLLSAAQLGFLRLARGERKGAMPLLEAVLAKADYDLSDRVRDALGLPRALRRKADVPRSEVLEEAKLLAARSLEKGYLKDALKYLKVAHENDPLDFDIMLKLGWANNLVHDDKAAVHWFALASRSPNPQVSSEAGQAFHNLERSSEAPLTTTWVLPFYSSRWKNAFSYAQTRFELPVWKRLRPYLSVRFIGDLRGRSQISPGSDPQYVSDAAFVAAAGVSAHVKSGITAWMEAGRSVRYARREAARTSPDYRGGVTWARGWGRSIESARPGWMVEANADAVYVSRYGRDVIGYVQSRAGWTLPRMGGVRSQVYLNLHATADTARQAWANYSEYGPGLRFRFDGMPPALAFSVNLLRGRYTIRDGNPNEPAYSDCRVGLWYAFSR